MNYEINEEIEKKTGIFLNPKIRLLKDFLTHEKIEEDNLIVSLESFVYAAEDDLIPTLCSRKIQKCLYDQVQLDEKQQEIVSKASEIISNSPTMAFDFYVYRGLASLPTLSVGDVFTHRNFIYASLHFCYARQFFQDTSDCYEANGTTNFYNAKKSASQPAMLRIRVGAGTHFFETKTNFNYPTSEPHSEIILNCNTKLLIESIETCTFARCIGVAETFLLLTASIVE